MKIVTEKYCDKCLEDFRDYLGFIDNSWHIDFNETLKDEVDFYWRCYGVESNENLSEKAIELKQRIRDFIKFVHDLWEEDE